MRQSVLKLYLLTMLSVVMIISSSYAILLPPGLGPSLDIAADATGGVEAGGNVAANIPEKIQQQYVKIRDKVKKFTADVEEKVVGIYKKIEDTVVHSYKSIENGAVNTYKKIEDKFVETFLEKTEDDK